jgi:acylglycerol lipase
MGESMGGAVVYDIMMSAERRGTYDGVIFVAPMVKILVAPPQWVVDVFERVVGHPGTLNFLSTMPWAPSRGDMPHLSFKDKDKMRLALSVPTRYGRKPRLATARELLNATKRISSTIREFDAPFIVLHGLEDYVTDPRMSEMLYNESPSLDKTIKLYEGMYHNLTTGETDENIDVVFGDAISWVSERCDVRRRSNRRR